MITNREIVRQLAMRACRDTHVLTGRDREAAADNAVGLTDAYLHATPEHIDEIVAILKVACPELFPN